MWNRQCILSYLQHTRENVMITSVFYERCICVYYYPFMIKTLKLRRELNRKRKPTADDAIISAEKTDAVHLPWGKQENKTKTKGIQIGKKKEYTFVHHDLLHRKSLGMCNNASRIYQYGKTAGYKVDVKN